MSLGFAGNPPDSVYLGDSAVSVMYLGPIQVYGTGSSLLTEDGDDLLLESGDRLLLESD